jgi:hypothetical protein
MRRLDWCVLIGCLALVVGYGTWRGRGSSDTVKKYMQAGNSMPWYAIGFSIMATQASAITFISTTGQSYVDGMRFVLNRAQETTAGSGRAGDDDLAVALDGEQTILLVSAASCRCSLNHFRFGSTSRKILFEANN